MQNLVYIAALTIALGLLAGCDEAVPAAPSPCALVGGSDWEFLGLKDDTLSFVTTAATDPSNLDRILAGTQMDFTGGIPGRLLLSEDGGLTWQQVLVSGGNVVDVVFDPANPGVVYAATYFAVYRSNDDGVTWANSSREICTDAEGFIGLLKRRSDGALYAGVIEINSACASTLYRSTDGAQTWVDLCEGQGPGCLANGPTALGIDNSNPLRLVAGLNATAQVQISTDGGSSWVTTSYDSGLPREIVLDDLDPNNIYLSHWDGVASRSQDAGQSWEPFSEGIPFTSNGGSMLLDPQTRGLFLLGAGSLWSRAPGATTWTEHIVTSDGVSSKGALHLSDDRFLYVGSLGLWRKDVATITAVEPGACVH